MESDSGFGTLATTSGSEGARDKQSIYLAARDTTQADTQQENDEANLTFKPAGRLADLMRVICVESSAVVLYAMAEKTFDGLHKWWRTRRVHTSPSLMSGLLE